MRKIGIDARLYFQTGVGVYIRNFIYFLRKIAPSNLLFYIYVMKNDSLKINFDNRQFIKREVFDYWHSFSEQINFYRRLKEDNLDLMHFTYFSYPILYKKPFIATIHDITPLLFKTGKASTKNQLIYQIKHFFFRYILASQIKNSLLLITPSLTVKNQILNVYGLKYQSKIFSIYEGLNEELKKNKENKSLNEKFNQPFFIYVGNFYPHKNVERLIFAFSKVKCQEKLILIGPDDFFANRVSQLINRLKQKKRIIFHYNSQPEDLIFFYKKAKGLIHPSLSEGFGLTLIEAIYFGCPIIASEIDIFKEILGNNYLSFNPYDIEDISQKLSFASKNKLISPLRNILKKFSFAAMTRQILSIYQKLLQT